MALRTRSHGPHALSANLAVEAWQDDRASPVAALRGHFLILGKVG